MGGRELRFAWGLLASPPLGAPSHVLAALGPASSSEPGRGSIWILGFYCPLEFSRVLLSSSGRLTQCHKERYNPLQCARSREPSGWREEFKVSREPTKDFFAAF